MGPLKWLGHLGGAAGSAVALVALADCAPILGEYELKEERCFELSTFEECATCISDAYPEAADRFHQLFTDICYCDNECASSCQVACNSTKYTTAPCENCIDGLGAYDQCPSELNQACHRSKDCDQFMELVQECPDPA
jgi:hypothetical protein